MNSAVVLHIPHSSVAIPPECRSSIVLDDAALEHEVLALTDRFTDELFDLAGAARVVHPVSRLVIDPERFLDDSEEVLSSRGLGVIYTKTSAGAPLRPRPSSIEREDLIDRFYRPHHQRLTDAVDAALSAWGHALVVDCHSFPSRPLPYELDPGADRPDICLGTDSFHTPVWLRESAVAAFRRAGMSVSVDRPFAGALVPMKHFRLDANVSALMVELNRRLYMDEATGARAGDHTALRTALAGILSGIAAELAGHGSQ